MSEKFIGEAIRAVADSMDFANTPVGGPPLPRRFVWRGTEYTVDKILERRREVGRDATHGSKQQYVRKHWFRVRTTSGHVMNLYFERQAKSTAQRMSRW